MIIVLMETTPTGEAVEVSREAVTFARSLAAEGGGVPVDAVVVGEPSADLVATLASYGVRTVHALTGEAFTSYAGAAWASGVQSVRGSSVVVMAAARRAATR